MNKDLTAQFLSAIITRNSGQRIEDDVKEALAYAETFKRLTADYITPQAVQELIQNPPISRYTLEIFDKKGVLIPFSTNLKNESRNEELRRWVDVFKREGCGFIVSSASFKNCFWENSTQILLAHGEEIDITITVFNTKDEAFKKYKELNNIN